MRYVRPVDPHVHLRGEEYPLHEFRRMADTDIVATKLAAVIEMPNCKPNLVSAEAIAARMELHKGSVNPEASSAGDYKIGVHAGMTDDLSDSKLLLNMIESGLYPIHGDKTFYCHSTGRMGIRDAETQRKLWELKASLGYKGVSLGHFEEENRYVEVFDYMEPITHSIHQPKDAEVNSVRRQLQFAIETGFKGTFYICHVTCPEVVYWVESMRLRADFRIVIEATFHHLFLNTDAYEMQGNRVKMNPPLRDPQTQSQLFGMLVDGRIDLVATDHAPHPIEVKDSNSPASGIPSIPFWPRAVQLFRQHGMSEDHIRKVTFGAANKIFKLGLAPEEVEVEYDPSLWEKYGFNPFLTLG